MISASDGSIEAPARSIASQREHRRPPVSLDLSILVQDVEDAHQLTRLLPSFVTLFTRLGLRYEILLLVGHANDAIRNAAAQHAAQVVDVPSEYGTALAIGIGCTAGAYVLTVDADLSEASQVAEQLWNERDRADVTIASRYVDGGAAVVSRLRYLSSRTLNAVFSRGLDVPIRDLSSGVRLYRRAVFSGQEIAGRGLEVLQQTIVRAFAEGWQVREIPFTYRATRTGLSHRRILPVGWAWTKTLGELWLLRNS